VRGVRTNTRGVRGVRTSMGGAQGDTNKCGGYEHSRGRSRGYVPPVPHPPPPPTNFFNFFLSLLFNFFTYFMYMYYTILMKCNCGYHGYRRFSLTPRNLQVGYGYGVGKPDPWVTCSKPYQQLRPWLLSNIF
jgi:hypothetical protein